MIRESDITVVLTTYNNSAELRRTLEGLVNADRTGLMVDLAVIDNNSTDATPKVVEQFSSRIPIQFALERRQGKCVAQNFALNTLKLGKIVFFTDDDVDISPNLFREIIACGKRHEACKVFGGRVQLVWPPGEVPAWSTAMAKSFRAYSHLDLGPEDRSFPHEEVPVGTNWWIHREVLERGYRFDEDLGPGSARCSLGDETAFLLRLAKDGYDITYTPKAVVGHRVSPRLLDEKVILRRGFAAGKAGALLAYQYGLSGDSTASRKWGWVPLRTVCLMKWWVLYSAAFLSLSKTQRMLRLWDARQGIGWNLEALRIACRNEARLPSSDLSAAASLKST